MKRKLITATRVLTVFVIYAFAFSACDLFDTISSNDDNSPHEHSYIETVTKPTCTEQGYTLHYCEGCGDSYKDNYTEINPSNHDFRDGNCFYCGLMQETEGLDYTINKDNESYAVSGKGSAPYNYIKIPSTYNGKPVTSIGSGAFHECISLTSIIISNSVTSIGNGAFIDCVSLGNINIPDGVTSIGRNAFKGCTSLKSITIPGSVAIIEYCLFYNCVALKDVTICDGVTAIGNSAFSGCTSLESITIPDSVSSIDYLAFKDCTSLKNIKISGSISSIDFKAFVGCSALTSIIFGGTISQWKHVVKFDPISSGIDNYTIYCTDGKIADDGTVTEKK